MARSVGIEAEKTVDRTGRNREAGERERWMDVTYGGHQLVTQRFGLKISATPSRLMSLQVEEESPPVYLFLFCALYYFRC